MTTDVMTCDKKQVVIVSVPYCEPLPLVAPVLLAACLEHRDISAKAIDLNADFLKYFSKKSYWTDLKNFLTIGYVVQPNFSMSVYREVLRWAKKYLLDIKKNHDPEYLGISIFTSESLDFGLILSYLVRRYLPDITLIAGGKGLEVTDNFGRRHAETWIANNIVDAVIVGDAETAIVDLVRHRQQGVIQAQLQTKDDLDFIPLAKWEDYDLSIYSDLRDAGAEWNNNEPYLAITASKGCVRQCTFCDVAAFWPDYIYRDPEKVAQEIITSYRKTGIRKFIFTDNLINGSISNFRKMNEVIVSEIPNTINYNGYAIFRGKNQMPEDDFRLAAQAGNVGWTVGIESGSEKVRYDMKKKFDNDDLDWSVAMLYKYKIKQTWLFIVGYPTETEDDFQETIKLIERYTRLSDGINIQVTPTFMLLNNSPLLTDAGLAEQYGLSHVRDSNIHNKFWTSTKFVDNDYPTRSRRWKTVVNTIERCGYEFGPGMPLQKWWDEINNTDKIYHEQTRKFISIHPSK
jgi:radical SAM superfamily enzyme YgiQ (UPF0313 family)